jgi:hypothetical protein
VRRKSLRLLGTGLCCKTPFEANREP